MANVKDRVVLITGAVSGIGNCMVDEFLENGARGICLLDLNVDAGKKKIEEIARKYGQNRAIFVRADITKYEEFEDGFKKTIETFKNLDIVVNNAGYMNELDKNWMNEIDVNLKGTINGNLLAIEKYLPKYRTTKDSAIIVNVSSIAGLDPCSSFPIYTATKHAVLGLSRAFGSPFLYPQTGIKVLTICPGITETPFLEDLDRKTLGEKYQKAWSIEASHCALQKPEMVAKGLMEVIEKGETCSVWLIEAGKVDEIAIPLRTDRIKSK